MHGWRGEVSHRLSGVARGGHRGQSATPDSEKIAKKREKSGENRKNLEKRGIIGKIRQKSGRFVYFAPPDTKGWLRYCTDYVYALNCTSDLP